MASAAGLCMGHRALCLCGCLVPWGGGTGVANKRAPGLKNSELSPHLMHYGSLNALSVGNEMYGMGEQNVG